MEPVTQRGSDVVIEVKARPRSQRDAIGRVLDGRIEVSVRAVPEAGRANEAIARVLAVALGVGVSRVRLTSGASARQKRFVVEHADASEVRERFGLLA